jgi:CheY-like chemotaxis protein
MSNILQRDGKEILPQIRAILPGSDSRVAIVTSSNPPSDLQETLTLGADAYFVKPCYLKEFMQLGNLITPLVFGNPPSFLQNNERSATRHNRHGAVFVPERGIVFAI